ncbi:MAG: S41 family peptidase [Acholeplasma sp.]|nr:S41 family peptidase [Acholeplasma sp.]
MKNMFKILIIVFIAASLVSCKKDAPKELDETIKEKYTVTFNSNGGSAIDSVEVVEGDLVVEPSEDPEYFGFVFEYWYLDDENVEFAFSEIYINEDITLNAFWSKKVLSNEEKIDEDIEIIKDSIIVDNHRIKLPVLGKNRSRITWKTDSEYISVKNGIVLSKRPNSDENVAIVEGIFTIGTTKKSYLFEIPLYEYKENEITLTKEVDFTNLTTEYKVADNKVELLFTKDGEVPYIKVVDFFELLKGFIDPNVNIMFNKETEGVLEISYDYYSESEDYTYHLTSIIDTINNVITTDDTGFFSAYVYSTETNYGRHIFYEDNSDESYEEGSSQELNLGLYNLDAIMYEGEVVLPYALVNQLFAGSSYYNVYYNGDGLYGVYSLPETGSDEYATIKTSSLNGKKMGIEMLTIVYNMLAFNLDNFYGLKDIMKVDSYYSVMSLYNDELISFNAYDVDSGIFNFINLTIDELHTSYDSPSHYNNTSWNPPKIDYVEDLGSRVESWYKDGFFPMNDAVNSIEGGRNNYWFLDDEHAVVSLDSFSTLDIQESSIFELSIIDKIMNTSNVIPVIQSGDKYFFINGSSNTRKVSHVVVRNTDSDYIFDYADELIADGFIKKDNKDNYFVKTINDFEYTLYINYYESAKTFVLGIVDQSYDEELKKEEGEFVNKSLYTDIYDLIKRDSALYLEIILEEALREKTTVRSVVLDIAYNTGGNVGALYRVVGFITSDPFRVTNIYKDSNSASSSYVYIDGVPKYEHLEWSLLISPVTFSAANSLATIFKENSLGKIIGTKSGGGSASITPILLPNGTSIVMSSTNLNGFREGSGIEDDPYIYVDNEFGVFPDISLDVKNIYNVSKLLNILNDIEKESKSLKTDNEVRYDSVRQ